MDKENLYEKKKISSQASYFDLDYFNLFLFSTIYSIFGRQIWDYINLGYLLLHFKGFLMYFYVI